MSETEKPMVSRVTFQRDKRYGVRVVTVFFLKDGEEFPLAVPVPDAPASRADWLAAAKRFLAEASAAIDAWERAQPPL